MIKLWEFPCTEICWPKIKKGLGLWARASAVYIGIAPLKSIELHQPTSREDLVFWFFMNHKKSLLLPAIQLIEKFWSKCILPVGQIPDVLPHIYIPLKSKFFYLSRG